MVYQENNLQTSAECPAFSLAAFTTIGDRENQQDCFAFQLNENEGLVILCDGMGGHDDGAAASRSTAEHFTESYINRNSSENEIDFLQRVIMESNDIVKSLTDVNGNAISAGTTAVSLILNSRNLYWCSAGDSRAYLFRNGEFVQFTLDQNYRTVLEENKRAGLINDEEFEKESRKAEALISYVGIDELKLIDYNNDPLSLLPDDVILLMSDGLYKLVSDEEICRLLNNFGNISDALNVLESKTKSNAKARNSIRDNMTVVIIKIKNTEE